MTWGGYKTGMNDEGPDAGHTFEISVRSRGSYAVQNEPHTDALDFDEDPFVLRVRAWSLSEAMAKAAAVPLLAWSWDDREDADGG